MKNKDYNLMSFIKYEIQTKHNANMKSFGLAIHGKGSFSIDLRSELFNTFLDACINDKQINPKKLYNETLKKYSKIEPACQMRSCEHFDLTKKENCGIDKKNECHDNGKKYYSGEWGDRIK